jgi:hypothetical protein
MLIFNNQSPGGIHVDHRARFSPEQQAAIINARTAWNARQVELGESQVESLIGNAYSLPRDTWKSWDMEAVTVQRSMNMVYSDLAASVATSVPIGKIVHNFQTVSDSGGVNVSLDGRSKARTDQQTYDYHGTPLPIVDSTFYYGWRQVAAAQTEGMQLDPAGRDNANDKVMNELESIILDGKTTIKVGGDQLYGLRTHPKRSTRTTGNALASATGAQWLAEVVATLKLLHAKNFKVPATIYLNWSDWFYATSTEYTAGYPKTIAQRVLEIPGIASIVPSDSVTASQIIAVVKNRGVVSILNGMPMATTPQFRANMTDDYNFVTMAAAALQVKFDADDNCGIAVSTI